MLKNTLKLLLVLLLCSAFLPKLGYAIPVIYINQVAFDSNALQNRALISGDNS